MEELAQELSNLRIAQAESETRHAQVEHDYKKEIDSQAKKIRESEVASRQLQE